jgi:sugar lactone lactonase YvrE
VIVRTATEASYVLAEGPVWDGARGRFLWVDIPEGRVLTGRLRADGTIEETQRISLPTVASAVAFTSAGGLLVAAGASLVTIDDQGSCADIALVLRPDHIGRLNDGKVDPQGRFVVGSHSGGSESTGEILVVVDGDQVTLLDDDLTLSNGLAWTSDGASFFSIDTFRRLIYRRPWSPEGPAGAREIFAHVEDGYPDGMTIDAEDHLWVAIWGGGRVDRYSPDGERVASVDIPAPHVSSVSFAGDDLRTLVVTTSVEGLTEDQLAAFPDSGRLFTFEPGVAGLPQTPWAGPAAQERTS